MKALDAVIALTSSLPDPGNPSFATFCGLIGGSVGELIERDRRRRTGHKSNAAKTGGLIGVGCGLAVWFIVVAIDRL